MLKGKVSSPKHISIPYGDIAGTMLNKHSTLIDRSPSLSMGSYFTQGESCILLTFSKRLRAPFTLLPFFILRKSILFLLEVPFFFHVFFHL